MLDLRINGPTKDDENTTKNMGMNSKNKTPLPAIIRSTISNSSYRCHQRQPDRKGILESSFHSIDESSSEASPSPSIIREFSMDNRVTSRKFGGYRPPPDTLSEPPNLNGDVCVPRLDCESYDSPFVSPKSSKISDRSDNLISPESPMKMNEDDNTNIQSVDTNQLIKVLSNMSLKRKLESNEGENELENEVECENSLKKMKNQSTRLVHEFSRTCFRSSVSFPKSESPEPPPSILSSGDDSNRYKPYDRKKRSHMTNQNEDENVSEKVESLMKTVIQVEPKPLINETARLKRRISQNRFPFTMLDHLPDSPEFERRLKSHPSLSRLAEQEFEESTMEIVHSIDYDKTQHKTKQRFSTMKWKSRKLHCEQCDDDQSTEIIYENQDDTIPVWGNDSESGTSSFEEKIRKHHYCLDGDDCPFEIIFTGSDDASDTDILLNVEIAGDYEPWIQNEMKHEITPRSTKSNDRYSVFLIDESPNDSKTIENYQPREKTKRASRNVDKQGDCLCGGIYSTLARIFTRKKR